MKLYTIEVPARQIPAWNYKLKTGIKQIMLTTWGGLGDVICGEPALRHAFKIFPDHELSLMSPNPELFKHLPFLRTVKPKSKEAKELKEEEWIVIHTNPPHGNMPRDFILHHFTQCVDFSTLCAFQKQIPIKDRQIQLTGSDTPYSPDIIIHPGRHWPSKTIPKYWYDEVILGLSKHCEKIAIIGKDVDSYTGTVNVNVPSNVMDLRNKLSVSELVTVCQRAKVLLTNDSSPLHIAASGKAFIYFIASCKEPEYITHYRNGVFGWRMENLGLDGLWNYQSATPIRDKELSIEDMDQSLWDKILPKPEVAIEKILTSLDLVDTF